MVTTVRGFLSRPVDIAPLVFLRIVLGALLLWDVIYIARQGWIAAHWIEPSFHYTFYGFGWMQPWPGNGMFVHFVVLGIAAAMIMLGLFYRIAVAVFFVGFTHVFLIERALYQNHFYLVCLICFLLIWIPAHRAGSLDCRFRPGIRRDHVAAWALWILRFQIAVPYFFGGLAKIQGDWLGGEPMRMWMARSTDFPVVGSWFREEAMVYAFTYGGMLFDLLIVPFLIWRRTRVAAYLAVLFFNLSNAWLFPIGIFPWFMIAATTLYFEPQWHRRVLAAVGLLRRQPSSDAESGITTPRRIVFVLLGIFVAVQVLLPLRKHLYPGDVKWTGEGYHFAWNMRLYVSRAKLTYRLTDAATGRSWVVKPEDHTTFAQRRYAADQPEFILELAHHLASLAETEHAGPIEVRAHAVKSLNGRSPQLLVDPRVDLAARPRTWRPYDWIVPLRVELSQRLTEREWRAFPRFPEETLERTVEALCLTLASGDAESRARAVADVLPAREDLVQLLGGRADAVWARIGPANAGLVRNSDPLAESIRQRGTLRDITAIDVRRDDPAGRYRDALAVSDPDVPIHRVEIRFAEGSLETSAWMSIGGRWIWFGGYESLAGVLE